MKLASSTLPIVYCHGLPGSDAEIEMLVPAKARKPYVLGALDFAGFEQFVVNDSGRKVHVVGFALGAMTALKLAALYPDVVERVTLIAPAAPLQLGEFLPKMAGRPVFEMALRGKLAFGAFTFVQKLGVALVPSQILKTMFSGSPDADMELFKQPAFKAGLVKGLKASFGVNRGPYGHAVLTYVKPWAQLLKDVNCPVNIYHGSDDNWAPIEMSYALREKIGSEVKVKVCKNLGHYSTLHYALPIVISENAKG